MKKRNEKTNTGEGDNGKRGRTTSDDVGGKSLSDTSTSVCGQCVGESSTGVKSTVIHTSVNIFETSKRDKPQYFVDVVKDKLKTIILSSSSGGVAFLTPRTTRGSLSIICQVQNTWSGNLTRSGRTITWGKRQRHFNPRLSGEKVYPRRIPRGTTLTRQWEKVEVMKRWRGY
jgi:hypothetical protein